MFSFVFVAMTYRSFTDLRQEAGQNVILNNKLQSLMDENLALQEEIHTLKTDKTAIERQASKIGLDLQTQTSSVPSN
jgi:cell division protein FtsB